MKKMLPSFSTGAFAFWPPKEYRAEFAKRLNTLNVRRLLLVAVLVFASEAVSFVVRRKQGINYAQMGSLLIVASYKTAHAMLFLLGYFILMYKKMEGSLAAKVLVFFYTMSFLAIQLHMVQYELLNDGTLYGYIFGLMLLAIGIVPSHAEFIGYSIFYCGFMIINVLRLTGQGTASYATIIDVLTITLASLTASRMYYISNLQTFLSNKQLSLTNKKLEEVSLVDQLTGINNRRGFYKGFEIVWAQATRQGAPVSFLLMDLDKFKPFNDYYGHLAGDKCLAALGQCIKTHFVRKSDCVGRFGGEEFVVVFSFSGKESAILQAQTFLKAVEDMQIPHIKNPAAPVVTISIGMHFCHPKPGDLIEDMLAFADKALYRAKRNGGNCVCLYSKETDAAKTPLQTYLGP